MLGVFEENAGGLRLSKLPLLRTQHQRRSCNPVCKHVGGCHLARNLEPCPRADWGVDLVRALAWFLTLDAFEGPYTLKGDIDERQVRELRAKVIVNRPSLAAICSLGRITWASLCLAEIDWQLIQHVP